MSTNPGFACRIDAKLEIVELSRSDDLDHGVPGVHTTYEFQIQAELVSYTCAQ